jgi:glycosyltransferase involved in cell wall biosynthesis
MKVLFLLKKNGYGYSQAYSHGASGLLNSATFIVDMLKNNGVEAKLETVNDNNDIDREVHKYRPDVVVVEALWVVPDKFDVLRKLHPRVKWIVRSHSDFPFLATEGTAMQWLLEYPKHGVSIAFNDPNTSEEFERLVGDSKFLPNYYPVGDAVEKHSLRHRIKIGCFGAIRPLKNQLTQAVAAIRYADSVGKALTFHVNGTRCEQGGESVIKNIRELFKGTGHRLVENAWSDHKQFLELLSEMDLEMCVSFTETFCIVAADAVSVGTPLVCSRQVPWAAFVSVVQETDIVEIANGIGEALKYPWLNTLLNRRNLKRYSDKSRDIWLERINNEFTND